ncbi:MAG: hypothetical protein AAB398_05295 [Pseudomonadota bacterium]
MIVGLLFGAVGMAIYGLAPNGLWFWIGVPVMSLWGLAGPASQSLMSRLVGPSEQGQLQGANTALMSIAGIVAPGLFAVTFAYFIEPIPGRPQLPGAPYLLAALLLVVAAVIAGRATAVRRPADPPR